MFIENGQIYVKRETEDKTYLFEDYVNCCLNKYVPIDHSIHETIEYKKWGKFLQGKMQEGFYLNSMNNIFFRNHLLIVIKTLICAIKGSGE